MDYSLDTTPSFEKEVTRDEVIACFAIEGNESEHFKRLLMMYAVQREAIAMQNTITPGRANLECALDMAELHLATGHIEEAHETFVELSEVAVHEGAFDLVQRINGHLREHL